MFRQNSPLEMTESTEIAPCFEILNVTLIFEFEILYAEFCEVFIFHICDEYIKVIQIILEFLKIIHTNCFCN